MSKYIKITSNSGLVSFGNTRAILSDPRVTYVKILNALLEFRNKTKNWEKTNRLECRELSRTWNF